ncbi:Mirror-image polydactyly gene 1 protein [Merluccius polli]|uniref:Mirror-image polydactyly gene 1 protein n=1 Tax=Merluccius polli TaxID=89951 RepID=A0AA47N5N8_MERPO|nr:Mirror-image polydactyly gene 1 protein [Merluccius polli]
MGFEMLCTAVVSCFSFSEGSEVLILIPASTALYEVACFEVQFRCARKVQHQVVASSSPSRVPIGLLATGPGLYWVYRPVLFCTGSTVWSMAGCSRSLDVKFALERAKKKISGLEHKLSALGTVSGGEEEVKALPWTQSKELKDSLVDMYKAPQSRPNFLVQQLLKSSTNPTVNQELRHRLSPPHGNTSGTVLQLKPPDTSQGAVCLQRSPTLHPPSCPGPGNMEAAAVPSPAPFVQTATKDHAPFLQSDSGGHAHCGSMDSRGLSREKNVSFLLKELDSLRAVNNKLQLQLVHKQKEVEEHQLGEELRTSPQLLPQAVLQELCAAQRDRDQALMSRLHLANEERDEALLRAKRLQQAAEGMEDITSEFNMDQDVEEVLCGLAVADSARSVQQGGEVLLALLQKARQRRHDITTQEMMVLIDERDHTATKQGPTGPKPPTTDRQAASQYIWLDHD